MRSSQSSTAPGSLLDVRPPIGDSAPFPGAVAPFDRVRPTAVPRAFIHPRVWNADAHGFPADHPYVRRYWTAAIGAGAVADLLRLATAARRDRSLRQPRYLPPLIRAGLASVRNGEVHVRTRIPQLPPHLIRRLPPRLRREHAAVECGERGACRT